MIVVGILVMAWVVILGPGVVRRHGEHGDGVSSISRFHRQLEVLEHSGAQPLVHPAYRLHSTEGGTPGVKPRYPEVGSVPVLTVVGADLLPRPALAFLAEDHGSPARLLPITSDPDPRMRARRRRRDTLSVLAMVVLTTFLIGFVPGAGLVWLVTVVGAGVLAAYVAMLVHMRAQAEERERKLHYLHVSDDDAWGEPDDRDLAAYEASRYAHPAYQAAAR